jgi:hypothetical protein
MNGNTNKWQYLIIIIIIITTSISPSYRPTIQLKPAPNCHNKPPPSLSILQFGLPHFIPKIRPLLETLTAYISWH